MKLLAAIFEFKVRGLLSQTYVGLFILKFQDHPSFGGYPFSFRRHETGIIVEDRFQPAAVGAFEQIRSSS